MELEDRVNEHDKKIKQHDKEIARLSNNLVEMQKDLNNGLSRVDESNRFLREQNTRQSEQNNEILQAILNRNDQSEKRKHELKMLNWSSLWKIVTVSAGAGGVISAIVQILLN
ncbi:hypothetical protein [Tetragenococcus halophilus]|uniref:Uncharacterized protein n=1 Tax=Tetragenococcus halophilus TaxID=51669 RepID=A0AB35HME2_TETHA|nr:hypothetical protein [Tetragenococcus halophilus]MCO8288320.1 hypothetical protein [Tetragenococcus halophilus]MCO8292024.1 hypothetical protein [Tetragenococcus halophilus]MCO8294702.1 hypothetical protein [Tetragenococcus halophilus]MCO8297285.1 hypothetical protein [Tetragenococcus halophilus]